MYYCTSYDHMIYVVTCKCSDTIMYTQNIPIPPCLHERKMHMKHSGLSTATVTIHACRPCIWICATLMADCSNVQEMHMVPRCVHGHKLKVGWPQRGAHGRPRMCVWYSDFAAKRTNASAVRLEEHGRRPCMRSLRANCCKAISDRWVAGPTRSQCCLGTGAVKLQQPTRAS